MRLKSIAAAVALAAAANAQAAISFDFDGVGGLAPYTVGTFDWGPTSVSAMGVVPSLTNFIASGGACPAGSCNFTNLVHATMIGALGPTNVPLSVPGLGSSFEITLIASFTQRITGYIPGPGGGSAGSLLTSQTVPSVPGFLQVFYQSTANGAALTGSGFNDGRLILQGNSVGLANGTYQDSTDTTGFVALDQNGANDYTGQQTVTGAGILGNVTVGGLTFSTDFFISGITNLAIQFANISEGLPYISVDPSHCFNQNAIGVAIDGVNAADTACDTVHVNGLFAANSPGAGFSGVTPLIGAINGLSGPDIVFQSDFNSPVNGTYIPEPASLALIGMGLAGLAIGGRRRKQGAK